MFKVMAHRSLLLAVRFLRPAASTGHCVLQPSFVQPLYRGHGCHSRRLLCTETSVGDRISLWRTVDEALEDAANNGHLYTDVNMVMAVQQLLAIESMRSDLTPEKRSTWAASQNLNDLVRTINSRLQRRPSPAALVLMAEGYLQLRLDCRMLFLTCCDFNGPDRADYIFECAAKCAKRNLHHHELWSVLLKLLASLPDIGEHKSKVAAFLRNCPAFQTAVEKGLIAELHDVFWSLPLAEHDMSDIVHMLLSTFSNAAVDSELIRAVDERCEELSESDLHELCDMLLKIRNVDLAMAIKRRVAAGEDGLADLPLYVKVCAVMATHLQLNREFVQIACSYITPRRTELSHADNLSLLRSFSSVKVQAVPEVKAFIDEALMPNLVSRLGGLSLSDIAEVCDYNQVAVKTGRTSVQMMEHLALQVGKFTHEHGSSSQFSQLLNAFGTWETRFLQFKCREKKVPYKLGPKMFGRIGPSISNGFMERDWPLKYYMVFVRKFELLGADLMAWARLYHKLHPHLKELEPHELYDLHGSMLQLNYRDGEVTATGVLDELLSRVPDASFPTGYFPHAVRMVINGSVDRVRRAHMETVERAAVERQAALSSRTVSFCIRSASWCIEHSIRAAQLAHTVERAVMCILVYEVNSLNPMNIRREPRGNVFLNRCLSEACRKPAKQALCRHFPVVVVHVSYT